MSFMGGFGEAFSASWRQSQQAEDQRKRDVFQAVFNDFSRSKERMQGWQREDAKLVSQARALVESSPAPEAAWSKAYEWLAAGLTPAQVMDNLKTGRFEEFEAGPDAIIERPSPVDTQMGAAGLTQGQPQQEQQPQTSGWQNIRSQLLGPNAPTETQRHRSQATSRIAQQYGMQPEEVENILNWQQPAPSPAAGAPRVKFTPGENQDIVSNPRELAVKVQRAQKAFEENPTPQNKQRYEQAKSDYDAVLSYENISATQKARAEAEAAGTNISARLGVASDGEGGVKVVNPIIVDGQPYDRMEYLRDPDNAQPIANFHQMSEDEQKAWTSLASNTKDEVTDYNLRKQNTLNSMRDVTDIFAIVDANPEAVLRTTPGIAQMGQRIIEEVTGGLNLLNMDGKQARELMTSNPEVMQQAEEEIDKRYNELMSSGKVYNTADAAALLDAKLNILTFRYAAVQGQEGRALSNLKYEIFRDALGSGITPDRFKQVLSDLMMREITDLSDEAQNFRSNPFVQDLQVYGWGPDDIPIGKTDVVTTIRESGDERLIQTLDTMSQNYDGMYGRLGSSSAQPEQPQEAPAQQPQVPPAAVEFLRQNAQDPNIIQQFDDKYGPGAAQRVLQGQ